MAERLYAKYRRYKGWTYSLRWLIGILGVVTAIRDTAPVKALLQHHALIDSVAFPLIGALTALVTVITGQFKWAERMGVALTLKLRCESAERELSTAWSKKPDEAFTVLEKADAIITDISTVAVNNQINWRGKDA